MHTQPCKENFRSLFQDDILKKERERQEERKKKKAKISVNFTKNVRFEENVEIISRKNVDTKNRHLCLNKQAFFVLTISQANSQLAVNLNVKNFATNGIS